MTFGDMPYFFTKIHFTKVSMLYRAFIITLLLMLSPGAWGRERSDVFPCDQYYDLREKATSGDDGSSYALLNLIGYIVTSPMRAAIPEKSHIYLPKELEACADNIKRHRLSRMILLDTRKVIKELLATDDPQVKYIRGMIRWFLERNFTEPNRRKLTKLNVFMCKMVKFNFEECRQHWSFRYRYTFTYVNDLHFINRLTRKAFEKAIDLVNFEFQEGEYSEEIEKLIRQSAESGHIASQFVLAQIRQEGVGVPIDIVEAHAWRIVAVAQNPPFGKKIRDGYLQINLLTDSEKLEAHALAEEYMRRYTDLWDKPSLT